MTILYGGSSTFAAYLRDDGATFAKGFNERDFEYADDRHRVTVLSYDSNIDLLDIFES